MAFLFHQHTDVAKNMGERKPALSYASRHFSKDVSEHQLFGGVNLGAVHARIANVPTFIADVVLYLCAFFCFVSGTTRTTIATPGIQIVKPSPGL